MQISGIFISFFGLSLYSRQAAKCSKIPHLGAGISRHIGTKTYRGGAGICRGGAGISRGGAVIRQGGYPERCIHSPPLHVPAPPLRIFAPPLCIPAPRLPQIPAPGVTILEHLAAGVKQRKSKKKTD